MITCIGATFSQGFVHSRACVAVICLVWVLAMPTPIAAQDQTAEGAALFQRAEQLGDELSTLWDEMVLLLERNVEAEGEERLIIDGQVSRRGERLRTALGEFVLVIAQLDSAGLDAVAFRALAGDLLENARGIVRTEVSTLDGRLTELRSQRASISSEELVAFERNRSRVEEEYDDDLSVLVEIAGYKDAVGLETDSDYSYIDPLLVSRSDRLSSQVEVAMESVDDLTVRLGRAEVAEAQDVRMELAAARERLNGSTSGLTTLVRLMDMRGMETPALKQLLINATGQFTTDVLDINVARRLVRQWWDTSTGWLISRAPQTIFNVLLFLLVVFVFRILSKITARVMQRAVAKTNPRVPALLKQMLVSLTANAVLVLGVLIGLSQLGIHVGPVLAGLGVVGFIVGFALQDTLSNFASGMMILVYRPFDVGDVVEAAGVGGKVDRLTLVSTTILTFDNQKLIVPNRQVWGGVIRNKTSERQRRVDLKFSVGRRRDVTRADAIFNDIVDAHPLILKDPRPTVKLDELDDSSIDFVVRPWVKTPDYWTVYWDVTRQVNDRFEEEGISRPFTTREVHVSDAGAREEIGM